MTHQVTGTIRVSGWRGEAAPAVATVRLLDTSEADASARLVAEVTIAVPDLRVAARRGVPFRLGVETLDPGARYEVDVLVDLDGDGALGVGDYTNAESYPVLTGGFPDRVEVWARRVGGTGAM